MSKEQRITDAEDARDAEEFARQDRIMSAASRAFQDGDSVVGMIWLRKMAYGDDNDYRFGEDR